MHRSLILAPTPAATGIQISLSVTGLDFPDIQHVINFDMPKEIENYVHRIGRTGRCGKTGVATTFINKNCEETILLDLKHLLLEAKQRIPPVTEGSSTWQYVAVRGSAWHYVAVGNSDSRRYTRRSP